jgi:hypothetical protein
MNAQLEINLQPAGIIPGSQNHAILLALQSGERLTPIDALTRFGSFRLGARILELRDLGYQIETEIVTLANRKRIASYSLADG